MNEPVPVTMPLVPVPIREVLSLNPGITAKRCAELMNSNPRTVAARLGKLADYRVIHRITMPKPRNGTEYIYRLKDDANA